MPVVTVRASSSKQGSVKFDTLVRKATEKASDLLGQSDRVLVVYEKGCASIYYEGDGVQPLPAPASRVS
ncbi:hypothetical protein HUA74_26845 [Myxococcus sp. CA051A]|uniref:Uncharacterized protein n=1 Tax=Myxococcus llanfairpwllgwyngyllgogerychwyrndrobwllllantysiliogogogochensis TaxID=2590453 RepID=A0A540WIH3_9BACT|nr:MULTISPECIES: hypothetical protein [Myxococcus]NTX01989.1 hypothetical protein [Myxococcus sp. CA040A]NTX14530.1 hypothetical protein [Myxococcus sp. CA056]NTX41064.1 hypothetical protein [Myxococcus sp. CA033]NTX53952.1 hypothetical protein [Myxococcus sp. CA039A]NTX64278.1 hypothetical protein [Myxococcus sp. CA051A]